MQQPIAAVMIHVSDVNAGLAWYQCAFTTAKRLIITEPIRFEYLDINGIAIEIVEADNLVGSGANGSVVYWQFENFDATLKHFQDNGANLYRGPIEIEDNQKICQVRDPWGNCIGIRGKTANLSKS